MSYILTAEEIIAINTKADMYVGLTVPYPTIAPIRTMPPAYKTEWYTLERFEVPRGSIDGADYVEVATARTKGNADTIIYRYKFSIPYNDVDIARRHGIPIWSENIGVAMENMNDTILHLILEGTHTWDPVAINGIRAGGTDGSDATTDGAAWDTVTSPFVHAGVHWQQLNTAGFKAPFTWLMSSNLGKGIRAKYGAGDPDHMSLITKAYEVNEFIFLPIGTSIRSRSYPIAPATADDGVTFMYKKDPSVFRLAQTGPPKLKIIPELNEEKWAFEGYISWQGTVEVIQATGIQYNPETDLA